MSASHQAGKISPTAALAIAQRHWQAGRRSAAVRLCEQILVRQPQHLEAQQLLDQIRATEQAEQAAIAQLRQQLLEDSENPVLYNQVGVALRQLGQVEEAIAHYRQALDLQPDYADAHNNLGNGLRSLGQLEAAEQCYRRALDLSPHYPTALVNLGLALREQGQLTEALSCFEQAIQLHPENAEAHFNLALGLLTRGDWQRGFAEYEWRWRRPNCAPGSFAQPLWDGEGLQGKTILLQAEQGLGDTIQFSRYVPLVLAKGGRVVLECQHPLVRLLRQMFQNCPSVQVIPRDSELPEFQVHAPLMSLPYLLGRVQGLGLSSPLRDWAREFMGGWESERVRQSGLKIGIVWAGNPNNHQDRARSAPLTAFLPLLQVPGVDWYSLQKGDRVSELAQLPEEITVTDLSDQLIDFADTAAAIAHLDLIITVDTAVAHLAGTMGKPVWILLAHVADWRWLRDRCTTGWYPTALLFRQAKLGDWEGVMQQVTSALQLIIETAVDPPVHPQPAQSSSTQSILVPASTMVNLTPDQVLTLARQRLVAGELEAAAQFCQKVLAAKPENVDALHLLGLITYTRKDFAAAIAQLQRVVTLNPDFAEAQFNLGQALRQANRTEEAAAAYQRAIALQPHYADAHHNLGHIRESQGDWDAARYHYEQAIAHQPDFASALNSLGALLYHQRDLARASEILYRAVALKPDYMEAWSNLGVSLYERRQVSAAMEALERAIALKPDYAEAHFNRGVVLLSQGNWQEGFREYDWRYHRPDLTFPSFPKPQWDGSNPQGKTILLHTEQGAGDCIQFIRLAPRLREQGARVLLVCSPDLTRLLATAPGVDQIFSSGEPLPEFDFYLPLLSLPARLGLTLETIPLEIPYLGGGVSGAKQSNIQNLNSQIGIVWAGSPLNPKDRERSLSLETLLPVLSVPDVEFFSLQKGDRASDLIPFLEAHPELNIQDLANGLQDFADTAAVIQKLDLVVTVDTAVAHLAGALGKPAWLLLHHVPDWRWLWDREDSPWYPTLRLFRQQTPGDWTDVMETVRNSLVKWKDEGDGGERTLTDNGSAKRQNETQSLDLKTQNSTPVTLTASEALATAQNHIQTGNLEKAERLCRKVLANRPTYALALETLGLALCQGRKFEEAISVYETFLTHHPPNVGVLHNLGMSHAELGQLDRAVELYQQVLAIDPNASRTYYNLGNALKAQTKMEAAITAYKDAIAHQPDYAEAHHNLAFVYQQQNQFAEAIGYYDRALELRPHYPEAHHNLASIYRAQGNRDKSLYHVQCALEQRPDYPEALTLKGLLHYYHGEFAPAHQCYRRALELAPHYSSAHFNQSLMMLLLGDLRRGFAEYEWRWQRQDYKPRPFQQPQWDGSDLTGKTILVYGEQGFGDTIQFLRYVPLVAQRGGRIILECLEPLKPLLEGVSCVDQVYIKGATLPNFDCHIALMSLPHIFGTTLQDVPVPIPYLYSSNSSKPNSQNEHLDHKILQGGEDRSPEALPLQQSKIQNPKSKIGFVWAGNPHNPNDRDRSSQLHHWLPLFQLPEITWYSLQKGDKVAELQALGEDVGIVDLDPELRNFADTARAIAQLDLVITVDTAVAHLAGAMGKPVWVLLCHVPDWRWLWNRPDSPWYPTARLFRQTSHGDWAGVIAQVEEALQEWLIAPHTPPQTANLNIQTSLTLARQHLHKRQLTETEALCWEILRTAPEQVNALNLLGLVADYRSKFSTAIAVYQRAITCHPDDPEAYNNLGNTLQRQGQYEGAIPYYNRAIALKPDYTQAFNNRGAALEEVGRYDESIASYNRALELRPDYPDAHYNQGNAYRSKGDYAAAIACYRRALELDPDYVMAYNNAGLSYYDMGEPENAIAEYHKALEIDPNCADAHLNLSLALKITGNLLEAWPEYEWRWQAIKATLQPPLPAYVPQWDGSDLTGETILLRAEQGLGDTLHFIRYLSRVAERGGRIILECQPPLKRLLADLPNVAQVIQQGDPLPDCDTYLPLLSLPYVFGTTMETIPAEVPYLGSREPGARSQESKYLKSKIQNPKFNIGFVWAGSPTHRSDRRRSCPLEQFVPLFEWARLQGSSTITFYSLQVGSRASELVPYLNQYPIEDLSGELKDFADTANVLEALDLVITVDTSVAHLAGAMGKPVWILLAYAADWRWFQASNPTTRTQSLWYPTARLFRQPQAGNWEAVISEVVEALQDRVDDEGVEQLGSKLQPSTDQPQKLEPSPTPHTPHPTPHTPTQNLKLKTQTSPIAIGFPIGVDTGWRIYGLNLALQLLRLPGVTPVPLFPIATPHLLNPLHRALLEPVMGSQQQLHQILQENPDKVATGDFLLLRSLGNQMVGADETARIQGKRNVGVIFSEDTYFTPEAIAKTRRFERMVAGSTWNAEVLKSYGLSHVVMVPQGVDPTLFHPAPKAGLFGKAPVETLGERFVIFSGGKLEYRKGQDQVIAAFRIFHQRHPDALLVTAWHNLWLDTLRGIDSAGHVEGLPGVDQHGRLQVKPWLVKNGIAADAIIDIGPVPNYLTPPILREADVALFPNRAEGGTNLVAMESLACGIPVILAANTGHLDLIHADHCYPLRNQKPTHGANMYRGTDGWGESDVEEIVETLEQIYQDRQTARQKGARAAQFMQDWAWEKQIPRLLEALKDLLDGTFKD
jgi:tetratricopeptide (TPR) repeat protein/ADP-heptose:LPS heptosyltransferase/glycosyltransferase involved in cell wall biosynthesis